MAIEVVDLPIKNGGSFPSYVSLPEGVYIYIDIDKDIYICPTIIPHVSSPRDSPCAAHNSSRDSGAIGAFYPFAGKDEVQHFV